MVDVPKKNKQSNSSELQNLRRSLDEEIQNV